MTRKEVYLLIETHYRKHYRELVNRLRYTCGTVHNAEDTVQEAYTRALKYWNTYLPEKSLEAWFNTIISNCIRDHQRDTILNGMVKEDAIPLADYVTSDPLNAVLSSQVKERISKLPIDVGIVLYSFLFLGYSSKEIAQFTEYKPDAVRKIVSRFREEYV